MIFSKQSEINGTFLFRTCTPPPGFSKSNGSYAFAYWIPADLLKMDFESTISIESALPGQPQLVDLLDGMIYDIPDSICTAGRGHFCQLKNLPVKDYPLLLTFGDFVAK